MKWLLHPLKLCFVVSALFAPQVAIALDLNALDSILPREEEERWLGVPWEINIMEARLRSQKTGKPLFIWVMDGHVLGST